MDLHASTAAVAYAVICLPVTLIAETLKFEIKKAPRNRDAFKAGLKLSGKLT